MKSWERRAFNLLALVVSVTGAACLWMKYGLKSDDPFAVINHPWQPAMLDLHVLASPGFLLIFGIILCSHVLRKLAGSGLPHRKSGFSSFAALVVMASSGYLLQVAVDATWTRVLLVTHLGSGGVFAAAYLAHVVLAARQARRRRGPARLLDTA